MFAKRLFDVSLSLVGLILLSPLFVIVMLLIKIDSTGTVLFLQTRVGRYGKKFRILKFRTMVDKPSKLKVTTGDDSRVTKVGKWLRKYKVDELPQLINVLKGDMSLVGPRPEVPEFVEYYPEKTRELILSVLPGITDDAAIKFSDENKLLSCSDDPKRTYIENILPKKLKMYEEYVRTQSFFRDVWLIFLTVKKILK